MATKNPLSVYTGKVSELNAGDILNLPTGFQVDIVPNTDHSANGPQANSLNAGETIAAMESVYLKSDGEWWLTDADDITKVEGMLAIALEAGTDGNALNVALPGSYVRDDTWAWTIGAPVYISATAGALTQTKPASDNGDFVRQIGIAITADVIKFEPKEREKLYAFVSLAASQTTNIAANNHVEFDTVVGNLVLETGAGQVDGIIQLMAGKTYEIIDYLYIVFSANTGSFLCQWYNVTNSALLGNAGARLPVNYTASQSESSSAVTVFTPATDIDIELRIVGGTLTTDIEGTYSKASIKEV